MPVCFKHMKHKKILGQTPQAVILNHQHMALWSGPCSTKTQARELISGPDLATGARLLSVNPLNPELNSICYLLALLGAHHFLHVSRIRVKLLTFRRLMAYIYIWSTHS